MDSDDQGRPIASSKYNGASRVTIDYLDDYHANVTHHAVTTMARSLTKHVTPSTIYPLAKVTQRIDGERCAFNAHTHANYTCGNDGLLYFLTDFNNDTRSGPYLLVN